MALFYLHVNEHLRMSVRTSFEKEAKGNSKIAFSMELLHPRLPADEATKSIYDDTYMTLCASAGFCLSSERDTVKEFDIAKQKKRGWGATKQLSKQ